MGKSVGRYLRVFWLTGVAAGLLGCQSALQPLTVPASPTADPSRPPAATVTIAPTAMPATEPVSTPRPAAEKAGLVLVATIGPTCPGPQREGQVCTAPYEGEFVVTRADGSEVARFSTGADGRVVVDLPPGSYTVSAKAGAGRPFRSGGSAEVTVVTGQYVDVAVDLDTGLR